MARRFPPSRGFRLQAQIRERWGRRRIGLIGGRFVAYLKPSFLPAESSSIDSRMRLSRVSGRLAV